MLEQGSPIYKNMSFVAWSLRDWEKSVAGGIREMNNNFVGV